MTAPDATATPAGERDYEAEAAAVLAEALPSALEWEWEEEPHVPSVADCVAQPAVDLAAALARAGVLRTAAPDCACPSWWGGENHHRHCPVEGSRFAATADERTLDAAPDDRLRAAVESLADEWERRNMWLALDEAIPRPPFWRSENYPAWEVLRAVLAQHPAATGDGPLDVDLRLCEHGGLLRNCDREHPAATGEQS